MRLYGLSPQHVMLQRESVLELRIACRFTLHFAREPTRSEFRRLPRDAKEHRGCPQTTQKQDVRHLGGRQRRIYVLAESMKGHQDNE